MEAHIHQINLSSINTGETQTRADVRDETVREYAELIQSGTEMDPAIVYSEGETYWLAAGHHRYAAYQRAQRDSMPCEVRQGGKWDAIQAGIKDNTRHQGERLTNKDKAHSVEMVLRLRPGLADRAIAQLCRVDHKTVSTRRVKLISTGEIPQLKKRMGQDGRFRKDDESTQRFGDHPEHFGLPDLTLPTSFVAMDSNRSMGYLIQHPTSQKHRVVVVLAATEVLCTMKGITNDPEHVRATLDRFGFVENGPWLIEDKTKEILALLPSEEERWAIESANYNFYVKHGHFPSMKDNKFWNATNKSVYPADPPFLEEEGNIEPVSGQQEDHR